ncbi:MAG: glucose PTS transporter subunit IIA [Lactobacillus helsingborgensis]|uniref:glucose PTS transporter subunit IIA n=1 Tax=Lactobacillus TaxID=1578 RepID=UPI000D704165|nr:MULTISPECIES: glucose PTS transporter subunit IIA [Lactobacillus]AWN34179.1 PTS beta-glucoside transporter subunit EIIBCA [Lactobacillus helsingborgensis]MBC6356905.1 PTS beta-glucoside transporter subunit EIIBCA [Lactobacillus helsingborgensis]MCT6812137.1 glucose PTS transporter subunit IIA [Lactobacillus helsingborgensis]MCT6828583.1 glucose PTS transporter subunit IIA [Lactobacillus helsingborgensis]MCT6847835.1 glucose PTS transporter subunit IIA [Lactobacillus helsingborgensis]
MSDKYEKLAQQIIIFVGGQKNINNVWHCMTRLRFNLQDDSKIQYDKLNNLSAVVGTKYQNKELQVVIGTDVSSYYEAIATQLGLDNSSDEKAVDNKKARKGFISLFMDTVSGVFGPIVPAIAGAGMIKGLMSGLVALNVISDKTDTFIVLNMIASGVFTFLPFFVADSAAKIFKTNRYLAVAIAAAMQFPTMVDAATKGAIKQFTLFGFIPIPVFNYGGTVIPIIFSVFALKYVYRYVDKYMPQALRTVFSPTVSLFATGIIALGLIGPISIYLGDGLATSVNSLFKISPILAGVVLGAIRPAAIFTGLHHAFTPIALQNFANLGYDRLMPTMFMANLAITGATAAVYFKVKSKSEKSVVASSAISGLLGITEPALFGVLSKYKKAFIAATIGSGLASAFITFFGVRIYGYILSSIFSLPAYIGKYFVFAILGIIIALSSSFMIAYMIIPNEKEDSKTTKITVEKEKSINLYKVVKGEILPLENVADDVFSSKMMGNGFAVKPENGEIFAPASGKIITVAATKHAIGMKTNDGIELLIHLGIDSVSLNGKGFNILVNEGDSVTPKTNIAQVDLGYLKKKGIDDTIIVVMTNLDKTTKFNILNHTSDK